MAPSARGPSPERLRDGRGGRSAARSVAVRRPASVAAPARRASGPRPPRTCWPRDAVHPGSTVPRRSARRSRHGEAERRSPRTVPREGAGRGRRAPDDRRHRRPPRRLVEAAARSARRAGPPRRSSQPPVGPDAAGAGELRPRLGLRWRLLAMSTLDGSRSRAVEPAQHEMCYPFVARHREDRPSARRPPGRDAGLPTAPRRTHGPSGARARDGRPAVARTGASCLSVRPTTGRRP